MIVRETSDIDAPRVRHTRVLHGERYAVAVEVEALQLPDDYELSFGPVVMRFFEQVREHLDAGDVQWLQQHGGKVYAAIDAA